LQKINKKSILHSSEKSILFFFGQTGGLCRTM
jgi:hypothetical protein